MTRVLAIGSDRSVFETGSASHKRQEAYAKQFGNLDIIVFSRPPHGAEAFESGALRAYPTDARLKILNIWRAARIAQTLPRPDVVTAQDSFEAGFVAWLVSILHGVPLHLQVHTDFLSPSFASLSLLNRVRVWLAGFVLRRAQRIRVVSEHIKHSIKEAYRLEATITVLPIFVDVARVRAAKPDEALRRRFVAFSSRLLVVSRLEREKNVELAIESFASAAPTDACLIIVGDGNVRGALEGLAKKLNVANRVFFEGRQVAEAYYKLCDLVLVPSHYEGYGLVTVEALAAGVPVLSTDVGIAREAGAIIAAHEKFTDALREWFERGPRTGELKNYLYTDFGAYVRAYCDDITSCVSERKTQ